MVNLSEGVKIRAEIYTEVVKGLLLANGGGAVALLAFLPVAFDKDVLIPLAIPVVVALLIFHLGIASAVIHSHLRRQCSLIYERHEMKPPPGQLMGWKLKEPRICFYSRASMWCSLVLFIIGGLIVFVGAIRVAQNLRPEISDKKASELRGEMPANQALNRTLDRALPSLPLRSPAVKRRLA